MNHQKMNQQKATRLKGTIIPCLLGLICLSASVVFYKVVIGQSGLSWSFSQKHYWNSVFEILILSVALFAVLFFAPRKWIRNSMIAFLVLGFSYLHGFFYAFIAGALYALMIWMIGSSILARIARQWKENFAACFTMGMASLIVLVAVCSILKVGTPEKLRIIYVLVFLLELFYHRDTLYQWVRNCFSGEKAGNQDSSRFERFTEYLVLALSISAFMIQVGRANIALDYDSVWYGLRSPYVLAPYTGIYDQLMMTGCVYVYSKGIETLSLAFSFDTTYSYVYAVNLMFGAAMLYMVYQTTRLFAKKRGALFVLLCCSVTAGIMNMASTAKSDISTLFLQIVVLYFGLISVQEKSGGALLMAIGATILSMAFKPTSIVFSVILFAVILVVAGVSKVRISSVDWKVLMLPLVALILMFARTYLLTGIPLTSFGTQLWANLGVTYKYPYDSGINSGFMSPVSQLFSPSFLVERIIRFVKFLFCPITTELDHVIIAWPGMLFSIIWLAIVLHVFLHPIKTFQRMKEDKAYAISFIALALISCVSIGCILLLTKPDGNYFMLMYAMTFIHGEFELRSCNDREAAKCHAAFAPVIICGVLLCIVSHWSWVLGFTPIDLENRGAYSHAKRNAQYYQTVGIDQITSVLSQKRTLARVMVFSSDVPQMLLIPAVVDSWLDVVHWGNEEISHSPEQLYAYYCVADMDYLLINIDYVTSSESALSNLRALAERGFLQIEIAQGNHYLLQFTPEGAGTDMQLMELLKVNR